MHRLYRGVEESSEVDGKVKEEMWTDGIRGAETRKGEPAMGGSPLGESCPLDGCTRKPTHGANGKKAEFCVSRIFAGSVNVTKECTADGRLGAKFGVAGSKKGKFCSKHAPSGMVNLAVRICATEGCFMEATHGAAGSKKESCAMHAKEGMVNMKSKKCIRVGCGKGALFGMPGEKRLFYSQHASQGMISSKRICKHEGCLQRSIYDVAGTKMPVACSVHAAQTMVDVVNKKYAQVGCQKQPTHGLQGSKTREFCFAHAPAVMINLHIKMCGREGCCKQRSHGVVGTEKREFCGEHAVFGIVSLLGKRCSHKDCFKRASHGLAENRKREFCAMHSLEGMIVIPRTSRSRHKRSRDMDNDAARQDDAPSTVSEGSPSPVQLADGEQEQSRPATAADGSAGSATLLDTAGERNPLPLVATYENSWFIDQMALLSCWGGEVSGENLHRSHEERVSDTLVALHCGRISAQG